MLQQEIQIVLKMDHPNIARYYKVVYDNNFVNIVMEYIQGKAISDVILEH